MGEATIDPKQLEDAMLKALPTLFPHLIGVNGSPPVDFYDKFQREAEEHDQDFARKYESDLDTTLLFAGLFSAVAASFIIDVEGQLQPDVTSYNYVALIILINISLGQPPDDLNSVLPAWNGPDPAMLKVEGLLYASLAATLLAAFVAMLGKQWLNRYTQVETRGSIIHRNRDRLRKMNGMDTWHFDLVMECLPLMIQGALLLFSCAISDYLIITNRPLAGVVIGFTSFGVLFYILIVSAATLSFNCPFQTPLSLVIRFMIRFDNEHKEYVRRIVKSSSRAFSLLKKRLSLMSFGPYDLVRFKTFDANTTSTGDQIGLEIASIIDQQAPLFEQEPDWYGYVLDSDCITWMFEMFEESMDVDVILPIMGFIPEVVWHAGIRTTPLERVYDTVLECFERSSGRPVLKPQFRNKAYFSSKALLHIAIQRQCICPKPNEAVFQDISDRHSIIGFRRYEGDSDLESILGIIDRVFNKYEDIAWETFSFSVPHHAWMGHILLYRAQDALENVGRLPDDVKEFVLYSLQLEPPPPAPITTDCLFIIGLVLGINLHIDDLLVLDKSHKQSQQVDRIYKKLIETFEQPVHIPEEIDRALQAMELIAPLSRIDIAEMSHSLFHIVMQAPDSEAYTQGKKWEASRLAMHGAYRRDNLPPPVTDPKHFLAFLDHHFDSITSGDKSHDEPIQDALCALAYASSPETIEALKNFNPTTSFIKGICHVHQDDKPLRLRKAALLFLPLIGDRFFNTNPRVAPDQMRKLCVDWALAVDRVEHTYDVDVQRATLTVLFNMINSSHWRPHIVTETWKLLKYFRSIPDTSQPLKRCVDNPELTDAISQVAIPEALDLWLLILWLKYKDLTPEVQGQLEAVTREIAQGGRRMDLDKFLSEIQTELAKVESALRQHNDLSSDLAAVALRAKKFNFEQAEVALCVLKEEH